jgi:hypothetical protein
MMLAFEAYHNLPSTIGIIQGIWVIVSHLGVSYAVCIKRTCQIAYTALTSIVFKTLMNSMESVYLGCVYAIIIQLVVLAISTSLVISNLKKHYGAAMFSRNSQ